MFNHVMVGTDNPQASHRFYAATFQALGQREAVKDAKGRYFWLNKDGSFGLTQPINGEPASAANGGTIGFRAETPDMVDAWHAAGLANGGVAVEDPPGLRQGVGRSLYIAYLRDPAGNKLCAVCPVEE